MFEHLHDQYSYVQKNFSGQGTKGYIGLVQCDLFNHNSKWIDDPVIIEEVRMASLPEIAAMKIYAIMESDGTRLKDFIDIAFLSEKLSVNQMLNAFKKKYVGIADTLALKSLFYFENIDFTKPVQFVDRKVTWKQLEFRLDEMQQHTGSTFPPLQNSR